MSGWIPTIARCEEASTVRTSNPDQQLTYTTAEVAAIFDVPESSVVAWIRRGVADFLPPPSPPLLPFDQVARLMDILTADDLREARHGISAIAEYDKWPPRWPNLAPAMPRTLFGPGPQPGGSCGSG
jgi:hypothetical protein